MPAYVIAQIDIHDPEEYQIYLQGFMPIFERYDGKLLVTSAKEPILLEGNWDLQRVVVMEFPDTNRAQKWLNDPDYTKLARHRHRSANTNLILVEGIN
ncbi:hypothetical protein ROA7450_02624 [Roseovarius albus]|uniref:DUF1330 domain-containing protein n=1 Tax=Roseovarius albus TaxID=1247867 RepID=A0A1X6ZJ34_9RHOB|nr:DUF1330 domain-containing protein [Roseovarius albus]SLN52306.1 hypothetical protein ROA7450_02624 [Roseovarius albus]